MKTNYFLKTTGRLHVIYHDKNDRWVEPNDVAGLVDEINTSSNDTEWVGWNISPSWYYDLDLDPKKVIDLYMMYAYAGRNRNNGKGSLTMPLTFDSMKARKTAANLWLNHQLLDNKEYYKMFMQYAMPYLNLKNAFFNRQSPVHVDSGLMRDYFMKGDDPEVMKVLNDMKRCMSYDVVTQTNDGISNLCRWNLLKPVAGLFRTDGPHGDIVRRVLIPKEGKTFCRIDLKSLEERCRMHFMAFFDNGWECRMNDPEYDTYADFAKKAGVDRSIGKEIVLGLNYGAGWRTLVQRTGLDRASVERLIYHYKKMFPAMEDVKRNITYKSEWEGKYALNPYTKMWLPCEKEADKFHTFNSSTATYVFDTLCQEFTDKDVVMQFHDEFVYQFPDGNEEQERNDIAVRVENLNEILGFNVKFNVSVSFGKNYAELH